MIGNVKNKGYRKTGSIEQIWYVIKYAVRSWLEWNDAKCWANEYHPAWVQLANKAKNKDVRQIYRDKIMKAYRGG